MKYRHVMSEFVYVAVVEKQKKGRHVRVDSPIMGKLQVEDKHFIDFESSRKLRVGDVIFFQLKIDEHSVRYEITNARVGHQGLSFYEGLINLIAQLQAQCSEDSREDLTIPKNTVMQFIDLTAQEEEKYIEEAVLAAFSVGHGLEINGFPIIYEHETLKFSKLIARYLLVLDVEFESLRSDIIDMVCASLSDDDQFELWLDDVFPEISYHVIEARLRSIMVLGNYNKRSTQSFKKYIDTYGDKKFAQIVHDKLVKYPELSGVAKYKFYKNILRITKNYSEQLHQRLETIINEFCDNSDREQLWAEGLMTAIDPHILTSLIQNTLSSKPFKKAEKDLLNKFCREFSEEQLINIVSRIFKEDRVSEKSSDYTLGVNLLNFTRKYSESLHSKAIKIINQCLGDETKLRMWKQGQFLEIDPSLLVIHIREVYSNQNFTGKHEAVLNKVRTQYSVDILLNLVTMFLTKYIPNGRKEDLIIGRNILNYAKTVSGEFYAKSSEIINEYFDNFSKGWLWIYNDFHELSPRSLQSLMREVFSTAKHGEFHEKLLSKLKSQLSVDQHIELFLNVLQADSPHEKKYDYVVSLNILRYAKTIGDYLFDTVIKLIESNIDDAVRMSLWLEGMPFKITLKLVFDRINHYSVNDHILIIKRLFNDLDNGHIEFKVQDLFNIHSESLELLLLLEVLKYLEKSNFRLQRFRMNLEILKRLQGKEKQSVKFNEIFAKCNGRVDKDGKVGFVLDKLCDGRLAKNKDGEIVPCKFTDKKLWWCYNIPCYQPSMMEESKDYQDYTLWDLLRIIKKSVTEDAYRLIVGTFNKLSTYMEHIVCRECNRFLVPVKESNYALDVVNHLVCGNEACSLSNNDNIIYITHCLNGFCQFIIDSRDNKQKCSNGWYICNNCNACCSNSSLNRRQQAMEISGQPFRGAQNGHKDMKMIFCSRCGEKMDIWDYMQLKNKYSRLFQWFNELKRKDNIIKKDPKRPGDEMWFLLAPTMFHEKETEQLFEKFRKFGMEVNDNRYSYDSYKGDSIYLKVHSANFEDNAIALICSNDSCQNSLGFWDENVKRENYLGMKNYFVGAKDNRNSK